MQASLQRLNVMAQVTFGLMAMFLVLNVVLHLSTNAAPDWLPYRLAGNGFEKDIEQRIEAAEADYQNGTVQADKPLCALLGLSGLREAADLKTMSASMGGTSCRYIGLSGAGGAIDTIVDQSSKLMTGTLRPDVAVIGLSAFLLVKPQVSQTLPPSVDAAPASGAATSWFSLAGFRQMTKSARDWLWVVQRRQDVSGEVESLLQNGKQALLKVFKASTPAARNPLTDPWREMIRLDLPEHPSAAALRDGMAAYESRRLFDPNSYAADRVAEQRQALIQFIRSLRARGATVVITLMPEYSLFRERLPKESVEALRNGLQEAFGADAPVIVDLRDAIPDSGFTNLAHVNQQGRAMVSKLLAVEVTKVLPQDKKPLMSRPVTTP
jgi:hypothetical protein